MKIVILLLVLFSLLLPSCDMFMAPFNLLKELLPLAIKYAPYALMFLEKSDDKDVTMANANIQQEIEILSKEPNLSLPDFTDELSNQLIEKKTTVEYVVAVHLDSMEKVEKIQQWIVQNQKKYKISVMITAYDTNLASTQKEKLAELFQKRTINFVADGHLSNFSNQSSIRLCESPLFSISYQ